MPRGPRGPLARADPLARLGAAFVLSLSLVWSIDVVSAGIALVAELALVPLLGVGWRAFWRRTAVVWVAAPLAGVTILLYGAPGGRHWVDWLAVHITDASIGLAIATVPRVLAIALPAVVLLVGLDATALADALAQRLRMPARFVYGALAAVRLAELFREDYRMLELARRARGVADRGRIRRFLGLAFALLVLSVRRGSALATAMEARGFGGTTPRSYARPSRMPARDWRYPLVAALVAALAITAAVVTGSWRFVVGA
ncbi:energy-coupling factor transporter transmembrane component T [Galbitalea sp. SE-J8]|nr:energy-coupling factor transporter transmembrane component T [Galbitalea sp. SE-J8]MDM4764367.1 energy-coupling factor transporter transmembrane component T [Galbitalea sp. SE-J8]